MTRLQKLLALGAFCGIGLACLYHVRDLPPWSAAPSMAAVLWSIIAAAHVIANRR